ncbi:50S ribosomal protein L2 [Escherichia coli]|uniref:50S ribosomal protein L2 n=1 Tax=Escherichia coli TaxID=562 RepID=A0A377DA33_ECOLX|nr:50S ribosomal protein L2 [Escherichia coli]
MAVVKCKPTSPGRRHVVKVVNPELHKGKPFAPLLEKNSKSGGRNNNGRITLVISVVATSRLTVLLTSNATKTVSRQLLNVLSTIRTVPRTSRWFCTKTVNAVTSGP